MTADVLGMNTEKLVHGLTTAATGYDVSRHIHHDAVLEQKKEAATFQSQPLCDSV